MIARRIEFIGGPWDHRVAGWPWPTARLDLPGEGSYVLDFPGVTASWYLESELRERR